MYSAAWGNCYEAKDSFKAIQLIAVGKFAEPAFCFRMRSGWITRTRYFTALLVGKWLFHLICINFKLAIWGPATGPASFVRRNTRCIQIFWSWARCLFCDRVGCRCWCCAEFLHVFIIVVWCQNFCMFFAERLTRQWCCPPFLLLYQNGSSGFYTHFQSTSVKLLVLTRPSSIVD